MDQNNLGAHNFYSYNKLQRPYLVMQKLFLCDWNTGSFGALLGKGIFRMRTKMILNICFTVS